jgi:hypothetical protein
MLSFVMLNVVMLTVVVPLEPTKYNIMFFYLFFILVDMVTGVAPESLGYIGWLI